jgi:hypothetical protein
MGCTFEMPDSNSHQLPNINECPIILKVQYLKIWGNLCRHIYKLGCAYMSFNTKLFKTDTDVSYEVCKFSKLVCVSTCIAEVS